MARHADAEKMTGLQTGGISALALLNRGFAIYVDEWITLLDFVYVSAGERGINLRVNVDDLRRICDLAGTVEGIGDNRVNGYGRFTAQLKVAK